MAWFKEKDTAERAAWVSRLHNGNESLGEVVKAVMESREAHWIDPLQYEIAPEYPASQPQQPETGQTLGTQSQHHQQPPASPDPAKSTKTCSWASFSKGFSRDGQRYCADSQAGTCQDDPCRSGAHKCAALFKSGRTCNGMHPGSECRITKRHASQTPPTNSATRNHSTPMTKLRNTEAFQTRYYTVNVHNGVGVNTDGKSGRNSWHLIPRRTDAAP